MNLETGMVARFAAEDSRAPSSPRLRSQPRDPTVAVPATVSE
jgi:hypothetical protein